MSTLLRFCLLSFCIVLAASGGSNLHAEELPLEQVKFFETHIRPLLVEHCISCHGPDKQKGELRLDLKQGALTVGGESGPSIIPHKPDESLLLEAVRYESYEMPPDGQLAADKIALLEKWIANGAVWPDDADGEVLQSSSTITEEDRNWWAFRPMQDSTLPEVQNPEWCVNDIDHYVLARLEQAELVPASPAAKRDLIRRVYFDTIGLPPTADEIEAFVTSEDPRAYEKLVDRLLEDPRFGEHSARQWLDLVRYAESDGYRQDAYRPNAWRYRDYVIDALNNDKPYDQFIREQLAGDELYPDDPESLVATGFLRLGVYEYNQRDVRTHWQEILNEMTDVTSDVFLGLGMGCARCHNHKFDPILQSDYYGLQAFLSPVLWRDEEPLLKSQERAAYQEQMKEWEAATHEIREKIAEIESPVMTSLANSSVNKFPDDIQQMMRKPIEDREPLEHQLAELANRQVLEQRAKLKSRLKGEKLERWQALQEELAKFDDLKPKSPPVAPTVTDVGQHAPPTILKTRIRETTVEPHFIEVLSTRTPTILPTPGEETTGRRAALANWLTQPGHPLTARVMVNRLWQRHFGRGLVSSASDFGSLGEPPTHPELLDWLALRFVEGGWKMKPLHRMILLSATYRQSSFLQDNPLASSRAMLVDPQNALLWRANRFRLNADQLRDAMLHATGELSDSSGGPSVTSTSNRRSIYTRLIRNKQEELFSAFDAPRGTSSVSDRNRTTTATQALLLMNGSWILDRSARLAQGVVSQTGRDDLATSVEALYRRILKRSPQPQELEGATGFLEVVLAEAREAAEAETTGPWSYAEMPARSGQAIELERDAKVYPPMTSADLLDSADEFTLEAIVLLNSLYDDATVNTIVSQWDNNNQRAGYALGVTSKKSAYQPRNLILQLVGKTNSGGTKYEVIASDLHLDLETPYYVAVRVKLDDTGETGVTFTVQELSDNTPLQTANVKHQVVSGFTSPQLSTIVGGRHGSTRHRWDGLIDQVRITPKVLADDQLLLNSEELPSSTVADWRFEKSLEDSSGKKHPLRSGGTTGGDPYEKALADLAHVLLNSNEFLYVD
ncbi:DUF1553 domain-containing protein [Rubinisphaera margarita]|uniref:DUF1553 domain-containing protein n=1 Tax=Rubinisphaera margarita TaxID=2909586 RepID=UPI001EE8DE02|nr:DUF1553 domain-containing protein [Rubinisphaera margarita]MCG6156694.1 DUF1553 domain-containing protein [Rubinisphaera margarita]